jgi:hypothetical protein
MTTETLLIVVLRLIIPLTILRWPLAGGLLALAADALDVVFASLVDLGGVTSYHSLDKYLDTYYLGLEAIVAQRWEALPRWTATFLFGYRVIGVVLFEATNIRMFLFVFPSLFENFFLFYVVLLRFFPDYDLTPRRLAMWLTILLIPKMIQEYVLHYKQWLDDVVAVDVLEDVTRTILGWFRFARIGLHFRWPANLRL